MPTLNDKGVTTAKKPLIRHQKNMAAVLAALAPLLPVSVYLYGWRPLAIVAVVNFFAFGTEWWFTRRRGENVTLAVFVTGTLLAYTLPPSIPLYMAVLGAVFAVAIGKELFGGMGRNVFNPALVGRAFLFINFPFEMTGSWSAIHTGSPLGGFTSWGPPGTTGLDAISVATPLSPAAVDATPLLNLFLGYHPGCIAESSSVLILLGAGYLIYKKVASPRIMLSVVGSYFALALFFELGAVGTGGAALPSLFAGGLLFGAVFMATDPVSASMTPHGRLAYGAMIGVATALIRYLGNFPEGMMFAILLGNTFGPIAEEGLNKLKALRAAKSEQSTGNQNAGDTAEPAGEGGR